MKLGKYVDLVVTCMDSRQISIFFSLSCSRGSALHFLAACDHPLYDEDLPYAVQISLCGNASKALIIQGQYFTRYSRRSTPKLLRDCRQRSARRCSSLPLVGVDAF
jgi:hypothetical protein